MTSEWNYGIVAFLDILGFSNLVEEDARSLKPKNLERLLTFFEHAKNGLANKNIDIRAFSDSIIISAPLDNTALLDILRATSALQRELIKNSILIRGAIAFGKHFIAENAVYSEALISAYRLERDVARFPRIIIQHDLHDWFLNDQNTSVELANSCNSVLLSDRDGQKFINYLDAETAETHLRLIESYKEKSYNAAILEKLQWIAEYHNFSIENLGLDFPHNGPLVEGFQKLRSA